jgi:hypothetical protein
MRLSYDFDMFSVIPAAFFDDPALGRQLRRAGLSHDQHENRVALFREPETAAALLRAPDGVRAYLRAAGFGTRTYSSGAPAGRYPARDEPARARVLHRLRVLAPDYPLPAAAAPCAAEGEFEVRDFLMAALDGRPVEMPSIRPPLAAALRPDPDRVTLSALGAAALAVALGCFLAIPLL